MPHMLKSLNELCSALEEKGALRDAGLVHDVFLRVAQFEEDKIFNEMERMREEGVDCPVCGNSMNVEDDLCTCSNPDCTCKKHLRDLAAATLDKENEDTADTGYAANVTKYAKKKSRKKKNVPNNPKLWAECQAWAKARYEIWPSAYGNASAARRYKQKGGTWRKED